MNQQGSFMSNTQRYHSNSTHRPQFQNYNLSFGQYRPYKQSKYRNNVNKPKRTSKKKSSAVDLESKLADEKKKLSASLLKRKLYTLTDEDKCEKRKELLRGNDEETIPNKNEKRIAHVPMPKKAKLSETMPKTTNKPATPPLPPPQLILFDNNPKPAVSDEITKKVLQQLISKNYDSLRAFIECPKSNAEKKFLAAIEDKTRLSLTSAMRRLAESNLTSQSYFVRRQILEELETIVDHDTVADICSMPVESLNILEQIFDTKFVLFDEEAMDASEIPDFIKAEVVECINSVKNESICTDESMTLHSVEEVSEISHAAESSNFHVVSVMSNLECLNNEETTRMLENNLQSSDESQFTSNKLGITTTKMSFNSQIVSDLANLECVSNNETPRMLENDLQSSDKPQLISNTFPISIKKLSSNSQIVSHPPNLECVNSKETPRMLENRLQSSDKPQFTSNTFPISIKKLSSNSQIVSHPPNLECVNNKETPQRLENNLQSSDESQFTSNTFAISIKKKSSSNSQIVSHPPNFESVNSKETPRMLENRLQSSDKPQFTSNTFPISIKKLSSNSQLVSHPPNLECVNSKETPRRLENDLQSSDESQVTSNKFPITTTTKSFNSQSVSHSPNFECVNNKETLRMLESHLQSSSKLCFTQNISPTAIKEEQPMSVKRNTETNVISNRAFTSAGTQTNDLFSDEDDLTTFNQELIQLCSKSRFRMACLPLMLNVTSTLRTFHRDFF